MPPLAGATSLGNAQGAISIDVSDLRNVAGVARAVSQQVAQSFGAIDAATKRTQARLADISRGVGEIKGELTGLSIGAGLLSGIGLNMAGSMEEAQIKLTGMLRSVDKANALMADLRKRAAAAGLPFNDMLAVAVRLLPTLQGNTEELDKWYGLARRVAVLNPLEGMSGAAFSINEALTSGGNDLVSLVERFNVSRSQLRAEMASNGGDFAAALDTVLNRMGITTETAEKMGTTFRAGLNAAKDAAIQLLAEGFTPLLQTLTPLLHQSAAWLATLRQTNPEIAQLGAGMTAAVAVGAPLLLLFNQLFEAGTKLKALGILGGLGRAGGIGLAAGAGVGLGIGATNAIGRATGNEQMANAGLSELSTIARKLISNIAFVLTEVTQLIRTGMTRAVQAFIGTIAAANNVLGGLLSRLGAMLPARLGGDLMSGAGGALQNMGAMGAQANALLDKRLAQQEQQGREQLKRFIDFMVPGTFSPTGAASGDVAGSAPGAPGAAGNSGERNAAIHEWAQSAARIEREAAAARLDAQRQYEQQRSQTIAQYNQNALREEADFQRGRARQLAAYQREIANVQAAAAKREAAWQADYSERIADVRADGNERLQELERTYQRDRERRERDHRDRLLDAAARLDAVAVANEQRRYGREQEDAQTAFQEQQAQVRTDLAERLAQEQEAHQERLQAAREADAERLADMQRAFEEQIAQEDIERAIQHERRAEDHAAQLAQMDSAHSERLTQMAEQAAQEKAALNESFVAQLNDLGIYNQAWRTQQAKAQEDSLKMFTDFWKGFQAQFSQAMQGPRAPYPGNVGQFPNSFADFGFGVNVPARAAAGGSVSNRSVTIAEGAVQIFPSAGMDERAIGRQVRSEMERLLQEMTN